MNYELAKQLKEAGFVKPEFPKGNYVYPREAIIKKAGTDVVESIQHHMACYAPTLEELIEACEDDVGIFKISPTECNAWSKKLDLPVDDESNDFRYCHGSTPTEAVANLWLALNSKD